MGIAYALISLVCAGLNDFLFRWFSGSADAPSRSVGLFVGLIGAVWCVVFFGLSLAHETPMPGWKGLGIGSFAGIMSVASNLALIEAMKRTGAGLGSLAYRLNLVWVAVLAWLLFDEHFAAVKLAGLAMAVAAFLLMARVPKGHTERPGWGWLALLVAAGFLRAWMGIAYRYAREHNIPDASFLVVNGAWWLFGGLLYGALVERNLVIQRRTLRFALISGLLVSGIVLFMKLAVNSADTSIALAVAQMSFLITAPLSAWLLRERLTPARIAALAFGATSIAFLAYVS